MEGAEPDEGDKRKRVRNASTKAGLAKQESAVSDRRRMSKTRGSRAEQHSSTRNRRINSMVEDDLPNQVLEEQKPVSVDAVLPEDIARVAPPQ